MGERSAAEVKSRVSLLTNILRVRGAEGESDERMRMECSLRPPAKLGREIGLVKNKSPLEEKNAYGTCMRSCSSASLTSSGSGFMRCGHVFSTIWAPASGSLSFSVLIFSKSICFQMRV